MKRYSIPWRSYLPDQLRERRKRRKLSQEQLSEALDVDVKTIGRWERGEAFPYRRYYNTLQKMFFIEEPPIENTKRTCFSYFESFEDPVPIGDTQVISIGCVVGYAIWRDRERILNELRGSMEFRSVSPRLIHIDEESLSSILPDL